MIDLVHINTTSLVGPALEFPTEPALPETNATMICAQRTCPDTWKAFEKEFELVGDDTPGEVPNTKVLTTDATDYLEKEVRGSLSVLDKVQKYLWTSGLPREYIKPLHHQRVLGRQIVVTENVALHLIAHNNIVFIKPIPHCLLNFCFFTKHVPPQLHDLALGFLASYLPMITHESDFLMAMELHLLPKNTDWRKWLSFRQSLEKGISAHKRHTQGQYNQ